MSVVATDEGDYHDGGHFDDRDAAAASPLAECDDVCFRGLLTNLSNTAAQSDDDEEEDDDDEDSRQSKLQMLREAQCRALHDVSGPFMYTALCRNILSDPADDPHGQRRLIRPPML